MIVTVEGKLAAVGQGFAIVEVGGVGMRALIPASTTARLPPIGERARLFTHLHVREDAISLYGFATPAELELFELLIGVRGLGQAKALALLSGASVDSLRADIAAGNEAALTRIPGIGRKLAAQLVLDLKGKAGQAGQVGSGDGEVLSYLVAMGFAAPDAQAAVAKLPAPGEQPVEERLRQALALLRPE